MAKHKIHSTTQDFTEIQDIVDDIVLFKNGYAASVLEVASVNFYLLSKEEQDAKIYAYMAMLNSLSFYIQILIVSKRVDVSNYLKLLDSKITSSQNARITEHLKLYKSFIQQLTKGEELLDKKVYIVVPFSRLELGALPSAGAAIKTKTDNATIKKAKEIILGKKNQIISQLQRIGLYARPLRTDELVNLFYETLNQDSININYQEGDIKNIVV